MKKGNEIDKLFKEGLENPDIPFNEADWLSLEERLHPKEKRRIVPIIWFAAVAGIAAMLLVVFLFLPKEDQQKRNDQVENKKTGATQERNQDQNKEESQKDNNLKNNENPSQYADIKKAGMRKNGEIVAHDKANSEIFKSKLNNASSNFVDLKLASTDETTQNDLQSILLSENSLNVSASQIDFNNQKLNTTLAYAKTKTVTNPIVNKNKPRFVLSILAAPDLTSVQTSGRSNLSGSFGAELTLSLTKKLSISTGVAYAKKIYDSDFSLYRPNSSYVFKVAPTNVHANRDVIDIPLNVNYKVFDNNRNSITVSTGLSSYLMLKEKYSYTYDGSYQRPQDFEVKNQNQHYLGIANIGVEFQHKINNKISIGARPFVKLPLTDIGYGNSKLSSTGVAVSLNMNLFKK